MSTIPLSALGPELILASVAVLIYVAGAFWTRRPWGWIALAGVVAAAAAMATPSSAPAGAAPSPSALGAVTPDALADFARWLALGAGLLLVLACSRHLAIPVVPEYLGSLLLAILGTMIVAVAGDLVLLFMGLEFVSIPTYILLYAAPRGPRFREATVKYFFLSVLASAVLLYGLSFLYGLGGSVELEAIRGRLAAADGSALVLARLALVLVLTGLGFKIAAVPFHFYAPDVYQGTTSANAAVLSVLPKLAGLVALVRLLAVTAPAVGLYAWVVLAVLAAASMTVANTIALWQTNLRRLLAYSSIAHGGTMLIAVAVYVASQGAGEGRWGGIVALLVYLVVYVIGTVGALAALACLGNRGRQVETLDELAGLAWAPGWRRRLLAGSLAVAMFSLAGIPPLAGFWGKFAVFAGALDYGLSSPPGGWFVALAVVGALNSAVAAAYYLRVVGVMFFGAAEHVLAFRRGGSPLAASLLCAALAIAIGVYPGALVREARNAARDSGPRAAAAADIADPRLAHHNDNQRSCDPTRHQKFPLPPGEG